MSLGLLFWVIMIFGVLFGLAPLRPNCPPWATTGVSLILIILLALLGWQVFGPAIHK